MVDFSGVWRRIPADLAWGDLIPWFSPPLSSHAACNVCHIRKPFPFILERAHFCLALYRCFRDNFTLVICVLNAVAMHSVVNRGLEGRFSSCFQLLSITDRVACLNASSSRDELQPHRNAFLL